MTRGTLQYENPEGNEYPTAIEFEFIMLGHILKDNNILDSIGFLKAGHFLSSQHAEIYERMCDIHALPEIISPISLAPLLRLEGGAIRYLTKAMITANMAEDPIKLASLIVDYSNRRELEYYLNDKIHDLQGHYKTSGEIITEITSKITEIGSASRLAKFSTGREVGLRILEKLDRKVKPFSTGISRLDRAMDGGMFPSMCYLLGGRKKMGKTTLAGTISCNMNDNKVPHLYIAAEMSDEEIEQRNLARRTGSYASAFRNDFGRQDDFKAKLRASIEETGNYTVYLQAPGIPFEDLKIAVAQAQQQYGIKGFVLDCLQLVGGKAPRKSTAEHQDEVGQWCATVGREKTLFSLITAQMNSEGNVRGGEGIRMACDQAYVIHAPEDDPSRSERWLEMIETRYTPWSNIGSKESCPLLLNDNGPFIFERDYGDQPPLVF